jgi:uncharacterized membrane protein YhaH (DUF805 family)
MVGYGPLYPVAYLPSAIASTPASAVGIATVLAHVYILVPVGLLCASCVRRLRDSGETPRLHWSFLLLLFALVAFVTPSLNYIATNVHVDAPALGLFLLAVYAVTRGENATSTKPRWLLIAGVCAGLSAACKVNLIAASVGFFVWIAWQFGWRAGVRFALGAAITFALVYMCAIARDGFSAVLLNLRLPGRMPWFTMQGVDNLALSGSSYDVVDKIRTLLTVLGDYLRQYGIVAVALMLALPLLARISAPCHAHDEPISVARARDALRVRRECRQTRRRREQPRACDVAAGGRGAGRLRHSRAAGEPDRTCDRLRSAGDRHVRGRLIFRGRASSGGRSKAPPQWSKHTTPSRRNRAAGISRSTRWLICSPKENSGRTWTSFTPTPWQVRRSTRLRFVLRCRRIWNTSRSRRLSLPGALPSSGGCCRSTRAPSARAIWNSTTC